MAGKSPTVGDMYMQSLDKIPAASLERVKDEQAAKQALVRIKSNLNYKPLSFIIPEPIALIVEPMLCIYGSFHPKTRVAIYKLIQWAASDGNWAKTKQTMRVELGLQHADINYWATRWPHMWTVANELCRWHADQAIGRVLGATTDAAIYGDSRDRRLYLEVFGHIKKEERSGAGVNITFVNDNLNRPVVSIGAGKVGSESDEP